MARILLTNNAKWANDLRTWFARVGFKEFARTDVCDMFLSVYRKLNLNTKKNGWLANIMCKIKFGKSYIKKDKKVQKCCIANSQDLAKRLEYNLDRTKFYYLPLYTTFTLFGKMDSIINDQGVK